MSGYYPIMKETRCINFDKCKNIHPTGMRLVADGWGLQSTGKYGEGKFKAICPECLDRQHRQTGLKGSN